MLHFIVTAAGLGIRTQGAFDLPKPFIDIKGASLMERVLREAPWGIISRFSLTLNTLHTPYFRNDIRDRVMQLPKPGTNVDIAFMDTTAGQAETAYKTLKSTGAGDQPLLIGNIDTLVTGAWPSFRFSGGGSLGLFRSNSPNLSYAEVGIDGLVRQTAEKKVISHLASSGFYHFCDSSIFINSYERYDYHGEHYISPLYNSIIAQGLDVRHWLHDSVIPLGTSDEIEDYLARRDN